MGRPAKYSEKHILDAARTLVATGGAGTATVGAIAKQIGAPTGSIYHRFPSRDLILAELWLDALASFQAELLEMLSVASQPTDGRAAALHVPRWVRGHLAEASILMVHGREELLSDDLPAPLAERAQHANDRITRELRGFAARAFGGRSQRILRSLTYALAEAPVAAVLPYIRRGERPPAIVDELVTTTYEAIARSLEED